MNNLIAIKSNSVCLNQGEIFMKESLGGTKVLPGKLLFEGEDPEEVCRKEIPRTIIVKALHPKISWTKLGNTNIPMISLNYLTKKENV